MDKGGYVYILASERNGTLYVGVTPIWCGVFGSIARARYLGLLPNTA